MAPGHLHTVINDLSVSITAEVRVVGTGSVVQSEDIAPSSSYTFSLGPIGVTLVLIKQGFEVHVPIERGNQVIYASDFFPSINLQTVINDFNESIEAEVRIVGPGASANLAQIAPSSSLSFSLGPLGVSLVLIRRIRHEVVEARFPINHHGGKQVKYASELFPPA